MQYKVFPTNFVWSLVDVPLIRLWKANPDGSPKLLMSVPSLFLIAPFGALILPNLLKDKSSLVSVYPNTWIFGRLALHKVHLMK
jgi:hypothetical protein